VACSLKENTTNPASTRRSSLLRNTRVTALVDLLPSATRRI
jgi:hypothetical protein